jgi:protein-tyrosine phosphatase
VIDLHAHILPGLDDGAQTIADSASMARAALVDGIVTIAATPHVRDDYPTSPDEMERATDDVRQALARDGVELELLTGAEIALDQLGLLDPTALSRFTLGGTGRYLLLEFPYYSWPLELETRVFELHSKGFAVVLAHPERNADVQAAPARLERLVERGVLIQLTSASLDGRLGRASRKAAFELLERRLAHLVASDAHAPDVRAVGLRSAAAAVGDHALARWLTVEVPAAIVSGDRIPERPAAGKRRRARSLFRRQT